MKKLLLSLSALVILGLPKLSAQIIPNLGFETWSTNVIAPSAMDPNTGNGSSGWWDFNLDNSALLGSSPITVFRGTTKPAPLAGSYYAQIVSDSMTPTTYAALAGYGFAYPQTNGLMLLAYINVNISMLTATIKTGIPCNNQLKSFAFNYQYLPNGTDTCSCTIGMYHFYPTLGKRVLIGGAVWKNNSKTTTWTPISMNINYDSTNVLPDTVLIVFSACTLYPGQSPKRHDTLDIDQGSVVLGINNVASEEAKVAVYPNPANSQVTLAVTNHVQASHIEVFDITGKIVGLYTMTNNKITINTTQYSTGLYLYKMYDNTGTQLNVGKFSVVK